jgi:hypothetical protein
MIGGVADDTVVDGSETRTPGALLAVVRFADTKWLPGDWTKALLVYECCLIYTAGRSTAFLAASTKSAVNPLELGRASTVRAYDESVAADAATDPCHLLAADARNWIVWSSDVVSWDLRAGIGASRLRVIESDGTRRKILWGRISNSFPSIRVALNRSLRPPDER